MVQLGSGFPLQIAMELKKLVFSIAGRIFLLNESFEIEYEPQLHSQTYGPNRVFGL